jgi:transposase-like protein
VQSCIGHLLRHRFDFASWKDRRALAAALKEIYLAVDPAAAEAALAAFEARRLSDCAVDLALRVNAKADFVRSVE